MRLKGRSSSAGPLTALLARFPGGERLVRLLEASQGFFFLTVFGVWSIGLFLFGALSDQSGAFQRVLCDFRDQLLHHRRSIMNALDGKTRRRRASLQTLRLNVKPKFFRKLSLKREEAIRRDLLIAAPGDEVPALLPWRGKVLKASIRLKGDRVDHLSSDKWSFRVQLKGDATLLGMKCFSLHQPRTRDSLYEWIFHQILIREGVIGLRYDFVNLTLNNRDLGIYALEEHFDKRLVEAQRRREGPIVRFREDLHWQFHVEHRKQAKFWTAPYPLEPLRFKNTSGLVESAQIDVFNSKRWKADPERQALRRRAIAMLEALRRGTLAAHEAMDVEKTARFLAICDLFRNRHALSWNNMRFFFDPVTSRLEPIGFDASSPEERHDPIGCDGGPWVGRQPSDPPLPLECNLFVPKRLLSDPVLFVAYVRALDRLSRPPWLQGHFTELEGRLVPLRDTLRSEPLQSEAFEYLSQQDFYAAQQEQIRLRLHRQQALRAYHSASAAGKLVLSLASIQPFPVEVLELRSSDGRRYRPVVGEDVILPGRVPLSSPVERRLSFAPLPGVPASPGPTTLTLIHRLLGLDERREVTVLDGEGLPIEALRVHLPSSITTGSPPFLRRNEETGDLHVLPGDWTLDVPLVIPGGGLLHCGPGTRLDLRSKAFIVSYRALQLVGTAEAPITIESSDGTGQGLVVLGAHRPSLLEHVTIRDMSCPSRSGWTLTAGLTFHESPVVIDACRFLNGRSEDALNLVRTNFELRNCRFEGSASDAFDADFCEGKIFDTRFTACGNDAIDVSGSKVSLRRIVVDGAGDKGLSAGEDSRVDARFLEIRKVKIGLASKDRSVLEAQDLIIMGGEVGLAVYEKKSEFGPAEMRVNRLSMSDVRRPQLIERNSILLLDDETIEGRQEAVLSLLTGGADATPER